MSNFDDERQNIENDTYEQIKNTGKIGSKMALKTTTKAGKKLIARKGYKKMTGSAIKIGKAVGRGLLSFGKAFILAIKTLIVVFLSWGWILVLVLAVVVLFWILMPALKQYTFNSTNDEPGIFETNVILTKENKALQNYFQFYSDKALTQNKVAMFYNDVDYRKVGRELFDELNKKEYIIGPRKPTQIVPPGNTNNYSGGDSEIIGNISIGTGATKALLDEAQKHLEKKYVWAAKGPNTFDCSGFVYYCMKQIGLNVTYQNSSSLRASIAYKDRSQLQPGDFVFYHKGQNTLSSTVNHVAIYIGKVNGEDKIIHCSSPPGKVNISKLPSNSVRRHYSYGRHKALPLPGQDEVSSISNNLEYQEESEQKSKSINIFSNLFSKSKTNTDTNTKTITKKNPSEVTVVIDAGHGGKDPGAEGSYAKEKDINLNVAKLVEKNLKQLGYKTIMTRTGDTYPTIKERYKLSNQYGDLFISIHCNSTDTKTTTATGGLTMYWHNDELAKYVQKGYINSVNIKNRGAKHVKEVRDSTVLVLENATKPAALVELAFINNINEEDLLTSHSFQEKAAIGIANGLHDYVKNVPIDTSSKDPNYINLDSAQIEAEFKNAVFMGDSLTVGLGNNVKSINTFATGGHNVKQGTDEHLQNIINKKPSMVIISYGTNDAGRENPEEFIKNYKDLISKLKSGIPGVKIYLNKIFPGDDTKNLNKYEKVIIPNIPKHNEALEKIASESGVTLIDCTDIPNLKSYYSDALHFRGEFYPLWYNAMKEKIISANSSNNQNNNTPTNSDNILKTLKEMEGFISKETINELQQYWESIATPTLGWDWNTEELKKELNKLINYSYDIKNFNNIDVNKFTYLKEKQLSNNIELKDKYHREQYFNVTPELLYSLNNSLYNEKFLHTDSLIKPVKTTMINGKIQLDGNAFILNNNKSINYLIEDENWYKDEKDLPKEFKESIDSYLNKEEKEEEVKEDYSKYGLGTVFVYRPMITFNIERGIEITQVEIKNETVVEKEDGTTETIITADSKPSGRVIDNIDCKIEYVLERAITFEGEYVFKYEQVVNVLDEKNVEDVVFSDETGVASGSLIQSKMYEVTEIPSDIVFQDKGRTYIYNYLNNFKSNIPEDITKGTHIAKIVETFYDYKSVEEIKNETSQTQSTDGESNVGGEGVAAVEQWRTLCEEIGPKWGIDPIVLMAFIHTESTGNPHASNATGSYVGLCAMAANGGDVKDYFKDDPEFKNYTNKDILPNCSGGTHNQAEHERAARFNIEYTARRATAQMGLMLNIMYGKDSRTDTLTEKEIQDAVLFTYAGYQTGEYGQMTIYDNYKNDPQLYSYPGTYYTSIWMKHYDGNCMKKYCKNPSAHPAGTVLYSDKKNASKAYRTVNCVNRTYLEKGHKYYAAYANGKRFDQSAINYKYEPQKWFVHKSLGSSSQGGNSGNNSDNNSILNENESLSKEVYDKIKSYEAYEKNGWFGKLTRFSASLDADKVELMLGLATAMKEEITMTSLKDANYSFWDSEYIKDNFINGLPKGRNFKDYNRGKNSNKDWKKILNTVEYIRNNIGATKIGRLDNFDTSHVIGHAYEINANVNVPKTPLEIKQKIKTKVNSESEMQIGDILLLQSNFFQHELDGPAPYVTESAIFIGEENGEKKYAIVENSVLVTLDGETIQNLYTVDSIVRPISNNSSIENNDTNQNSSAISKEGWVWPTNTNKVSSDFGRRQPFKTSQGTSSEYHKGIDISTTLNDVPQSNLPILAAKDGTVTDVNFDTSQAKGIAININHGNGVSSQYYHLAPNSVKVSKGQTVTAGQEIAKMGTTGSSTGVHLHFQIMDSNYKNPENSIFDGYLDPLQVLPISEGTTVKRGGGKYNFSYQIGEGIYIYKGGQWVKK